jgi:hypothetical protein
MRLKVGGGDTAHGESPPFVSPQTALMVFEIFIFRQFLSGFKSTKAFIQQLHFAINYLNGFLPERYWANLVFIKSFYENGTVVYHYLFIPGLEK